MKAVDLRYSKSQIDKAGEALKLKQLKANDLEESLEVLSNWRAYHAMPLDTFAKVLKSRVQRIDKGKNAIVAQRLKRTPSILLKLHTHKTMRLSTMQDIGGLRAIFNSVGEAYELLEQYRFSKTRHSLFSVDDYIERPKRDGYRGAHLVYKVAKSPSLFLEIQIRSQLQHVWATGVEVFGTLQNSSFKSGHGNEKWLEFFSLVSSIFALKEGTPVMAAHQKLSKTRLQTLTKAMIQELKVIEQLNVYTNLYRTETIKPATGGRTGHYGLILLNSKENTTSVRTYGTTQIAEATQAYLDLEKKYFENQDVNVVLVNTGDLKKLQASYPNYFMDTKTLVRNLSLIVMDKFL